MPKQGNKRKKRRTQKDGENDIGEEDLKKVPRCFVLKKGAVGDRVKDLVQDFREVMMPNNARRLRESKLNRVEDFIAVAGHFRVSHLVLFTATKANTYMKLVKLPQGPTLTFKVDSFVLSRDVRAVQKRHRCSHSDWMVPPLQVLNGFGGSGASAGARQLTSEMLRGLFPAVDVPNFKHADCRRTALFNYDTETDSVVFRHYTVAKKQNVGLQRGISKLLRRRRFPKLGQQEDIADFVLGGGIGASASESEAEGRAMEAPSANGGKVGIRLSEVGPRMSLQLIKAEDGVNAGELLYHRYDMKRTKQEAGESKARQKLKFKARNAKLSAMESKKKAKKKKKKAEEKKEEEAVNDREPEDNQGYIGKPKRTYGAEKLAEKKSSHPFAWARNKKKAGGAGEGDGEAEDSAGKGGGKKGKSGGKKGGRDDDRGGGKGKGFDAGGGKGKRKGQGKRAAAGGGGKGKDGKKAGKGGKGDAGASSGTHAGKKRSADKVLARFGQSASKRRT